MGCDINMYAETKNFTTGKWEKVGAIWQSEYSVEMTDQIYQDRDYELFGLLAGVRGTSGHWPIVNDRKFEFPTDISNDIKSLFDEWIDDNYKPCYYTLKELLSYDWDKHFLMTKMVDRKDAIYCLVNKTLPETWCIPAEWGENTDYIDFSWLHPYKELSFYKQTIPRLIELGDPENVRIVFWFNN